MVDWKRRQRRGSEIEATRPPDPPPPRPNFQLPEAAELRFRFGAKINLVQIGNLAAPEATRFLGALAGQLVKADGFAYDNLRERLEPKRDALRDNGEPVKVGAWEQEAVVFFSAATILARIQARAKGGAGEEYQDDVEHLRTFISGMRTVNSYIPDILNDDGIPALEMTFPMADGELFQALPSFHSALLLQPVIKPDYIK